MLREAKQLIYGLLPRGRICCTELYPGDFNPGIGEAGEIRVPSTENERGIARETLFGQHSPPSHSPLPLPSFPMSQHGVGMMLVLVPWGSGERHYPGEKHCLATWAFGD